VDKRKRLIFVAQVTVLAGAVAVAALSSRAGDWEPIELFFLLLVLAIGGDALAFEVGNVRVSGAFLAVVLAMALLGAAPAAAIGALSTLVDAVYSRRVWQKSLNNLANWTAYPVVGGLLIKFAYGDVSPGNQDGLLFAAGVLVVFMITNFLNFAMVAGYNAATGEGAFLESLRSVYVTVLPADFAIALLTASVAFCYDQLGVGAVGLAAVVLFVFQYVMRSGIQAFERGQELQKRTRQLASLQVGLLSTVLQTLSMRDAMTARHSAAVARYSREIARMLGLSERDQELIHTAALLHDIGKFIFPDSILFAERRLTDEEWQIVRLHPEQGAKLVRRIEGYGPVADIILSHHERVDGTGYPHGLSSDTIPLGSRILAAADTYDVMTARDSYRDPVSSDDALAELQRVAGAQLDPLVVGVFVEMIETNRVAFRHTDEADFERELAFERRVDAYAKPRPALIEAS
jgi:putative nucleotidyltransferase with HDIG domain